jgi:hypothetical protein
MDNFDADFLHFCLTSCILSTLFCDEFFESMQHAEFANGVM